MDASGGFSAWMSASQLRASVKSGYQSNIMLFELYRYIIEELSIQCDAWTLEIFGL